MIFSVIKNEKSVNPLAVFNRYLDTADTMHPWGRDVKWNQKKTEFIIDELDEHDAVHLMWDCWLVFPDDIIPFNPKGLEKKGLVPNVFPFAFKKA